MVGERMTTPHICLIGGSGRSGTTILKEAFANHPQVVTAGEIRITTDPEGIVDFYNSCSDGWSPYFYDVKVRRLQKLLKDAGKSTFLRKVYAHVVSRSQLRNLPFIPISRYAEVNLEKHCARYFQFVDELLKELVDFRYHGRWTGCEFLQDAQLFYKLPVAKIRLAEILGAFLRKVFGEIIETHAAGYFVEDTPWNILWFDKLRELLPEAKLVHIYRDPRDVVASYTKQWWAPSDAVQAAYWYKGIIEQWWSVRAHLPSDSFKEIALEQFVDNAENIITDLCSFWDIPHHPSLMATDLSHSHAGRWKRELTAREQQEVSAILEEPLKLMGYS